ncbi:MAG: tributyrin esterase [Methanotrichaceae archaeon]|nr:tributyrin esterase [Methanotrichaceae archaeon]
MGRVDRAVEIQSSGESSIGDFTFDFYWQHKGSRLDPDSFVGGHSHREIVDALKRGEDVHISGDVGGRLGSSMGVELVAFGGRGREIEGTGRLIVEGDAGSRMGISMVRGSIYLSGRPAPPLGNVIEVESDLSGYRKFISITEAIKRSIEVLDPNELVAWGLLLRDSTLRETVGARNRQDKTISLEGNAGMSTGILMRAGRIVVEGSAGRNTGVLLRGGTIVVKKDCEDFTATEMVGGEIFVGGDAGNFIASQMVGGAIYARAGKPVPPAKSYPPGEKDLRRITSELGLSPIQAMAYRKFCP